MTDRVAMVVHRDEVTRRLVSRALSVFSPAHDVITADTLASASQWIDTAKPDVVLLMGDDEHIEASTTWVRQHAVSPSRVILIGANGMPGDFRGSVGVSEPVEVAALLAAVRQLADSAPVR